MSVHQMLMIIKHLSFSIILSFFPLIKLAMWWQCYNNVAARLYQYGENVTATFFLCQVSKLATASNISVRVGCFCNRGACEFHLNLTTDTILQNFEVHLFQILNFSVIISIFKKNINNKENLKTKIFDYKKITNKYNEIFLLSKIGLHVDCTWQQ